MYENSTPSFPFLTNNELSNLYDDFNEVFCFDTKTSQPELMKIIKKYTMDIGSLNFLPHLHGKPSKASILADRLIGNMNLSPDSFDSSSIASLIEVEFLKWVCNEIDYSDGDGTMTTGATESCMMAMIAARKKYFSEIDFDIDKEGMAFVDIPSIICSEDAHFSVEQTARFLGFGTDKILKVKTENGKMNIAELQNLVDLMNKQDKPIMMIVATAGTTMYGTFDDIVKISEIAKKQKAWLHVDGAAGGAFIFSKRHKHLVKGIDKADSVSIDGHKLLAQTIPCGLFLIKNKNDLLNFSNKSDYLNPDNPIDATCDYQMDLVERSMLTTRRLESLKLWFHIKSLGIDSFRESIDVIPEISKKVGKIIDKDSRYTLVNDPVSFSIIFKHNIYDNRLIPEIVFRSGFYTIGKGKIGDEHILRFTITTEEYQNYDFEKALDDIDMICQKYFNPPLNNSKQLINT